MNRIYVCQNGKLTIYGDIDKNVPNTENELKIAELENLLERWEHITPKYIEQIIKQEYCQNLDFDFYVETDKLYLLIETFNFIIFRLSSLLYAPAQGLNLPLSTAILCDFLISNFLTILTTPLIAELLETLPEGLVSTLANIACKGHADEINRISQYCEKIKQDARQEIANLRRQPCYKLIPEGLSGRIETFDNEPQFTLENQINKYFMQINQDDDDYKRERKR